MIRKTDVAKAAALAVSLVFSASVWAQSSEGSIYGQAKPGAAVTVVNTETGLTRQIQAEGSGSFTFSRLAPGRYRVTTAGVTREVTVAIGSGTQVSFEATQVLVVGSRVLRSIDVNSVESNTVLTQEQIQALPVPRDFNAVAALAPGVVKGDSGLGAGNLPSIGGASVAENGYYINGFDVTNIRNFVSYAALPFDALGQQQVKTGGYGAEYGRSLGGVVSLVTKRGTNEWKGGGALYWEPRSLRAPGKDVRDKDLDRLNSFYRFNSANKVETLSYNIYGGGPIIKDKLFVFALVEGLYDTTDTFGETQSTKRKDTRPNGMVKVDFAPLDSHLFEFTAIDTKKKFDYTDYKQTEAQAYSRSHVGTPGSSTRTSGGSVGILKYTGYLTDNFTVSALAGRVNDMRPKFTGARTGGAECPTVFNVGATVALGCWVEPFPGTPGRDPAAPDDRDLRTSYRVDFEYILGSHTIRAGLDNQKFKSWEAGGSPYSGGEYWRYFVTPAGGGTVRGVTLPGNTPYVRLRTSNNTSGQYEVINEALYIEDSWKFSKNLLLYAGIRSESFNNKNGDNISFIKQDNLLAPRLGFSWDVNGDSSLKLFANAGRYFIPVASNTNIRATRGEASIEAFYQYTGQDPRTAAPTGLTQIGTTQVNSDGRIPNPATISSTNLSPMNQDELILGFQKALTKGWSAGAKITYRKINDGMDDFCGHYPMVNWAADNGYTAFKPGTLAPCIMLNPGRDVSLAMDLQNNGSLSTVTIPSKYFNLATYKRTYSALELTLDKPFDGKWGMQASYVWSKSRGTAEGYVQSQLNQEDAGLTQDFDFGSFTDGAEGYLPNDRRHVIKAFGNYAVSEEWRLGANLTLASGRPYSCIGFVPNTVPDYDETWKSSPSSYYCRTSATEVKLVPRGSAGRTSWTTQLDLQFSYVPKWASSKLTLAVDIFNVYNSRKATELNEVRDYDQATGVTPPYRLNLNYLSPSSFQDSRSVRLSARYEF